MQIIVSKKVTGKRVACWLTPYQAAQLELLRTAGLPGGMEPLSANQAIVKAILEASHRVKNDNEPTPTPASRMVR